MDTQIIYDVLGKCSCSTNVRPLCDQGFALSQKVHKCLGEYVGRNYVAKYRVHKISEVPKFMNL